MCYTRYPLSLDIFIYEIARWIAEISSNETNWSGFGQCLFSSIGNELQICLTEFDLVPLTTYS